MNDFEWIQPDTVAGAVAALQHPGAMPLAGGVDLLDRLKEHLVSPSRLVSLRKLPGFDAITVDAGGTVTIGAGVTLARLETDPALRASHAILGDAAGHAATPQLREMATIGGNLAQRPRCWYFRDETFPCRRKGGAVCFAQDGDAAMHAVFDNQICAATHPSTVVTALIALGARVVIAGAKGGREVELGRFFVAPETDVTREVDLAPGELITAVVVPRLAAGARTAYTKQVAKQSFDWPLVDVAVALTVEGRTCRQAIIVLGAVAPTPRRATEAERALAGQVVDAAACARAARAALTGATPLAGNEHKLPILEAVVARTLLAAAGRPS